MRQRGSTRPGETGPHAFLDPCRACDYTVSEFAVSKFGCRPPLRPPSHLDEVQEMDMKPRLLQLLTVALVLALGLAAGCSRGARSDAQIADDVHAKIVADANVQNKDIAVQSNNGLVTLSGAVGSETERGAAASDAAQVEGVKTVVNNLSVVPGRSASAAHGALARRAAEPAPAAAAPAAALAIPAGTRISIRMIDSIDSEKNKPGDTFRASLDAPLVVGEKVVV